MSKVIQKIIKITAISSCYLMAILSIKSVSAANPENVTYQVNVAPSLVVEVPTGNDVVLDLNPNSKTFDYEDVQVIVRTNNITGYQLNVTTADNHTYLTRNTSSDVTPINAQMDTLASSATGYSDSDFSNCTIADCVNKWGYKVTSSDTDPSLVTANYFPFTTNTLLATNHYATNGDSTTLRFAAKIDWDQMAGTYENTLVFTATATYAEYTINYYDGVGNQIATQSNPYNTSATVPINPTYSGGYTAPHRTGLSADTYTFIGWCDQQPGGETSEGYFAATTCPSGHEHAPGSTLTIDPTEYSTDLNLYAYWDPTTFAEAYQAAGATSTMSATPTSGSARTAYIMQNMTPAICAAVTAGETEFLGDNRSGNYGYYVGKLKDEKCWMVQNLRLGTNFSTSTTLGLTPGNTDITSNYTLSGKRSSPGQMPYSDCPSTATSGCKEDRGSDGYPYDGNAFYCAPATSDPTENYYQGCYYNWYTATASSGTSSITPVGTSVGYKDVSNSICPKGWHLPSSGGIPLSGSTPDRPDSDFNVLYNDYPSSTQIANTGTCTASGGAGCDNASGTNIPSFLFSGYYGIRSSGGTDIGGRGLYWSRSAYSKSIAYFFDLFTHRANPRNTAHKSYGFSIRCLAYSS